MPGVTGRTFQFSSRRMLISARIVSSKARSLIGSTMPLVPRIEIPPSIPSFGLKVFAASSLPRGTLTVTSKPAGSRTPPASCIIPVPGRPPASRTASCTASAIMRRGVLLMAAFPTGWSRPGLVTRPTPSPPSILIPGIPEQATSARTRIPSVTSGSSPLSFRTAQETAPSEKQISSISRYSSVPRGVLRRTCGTFSPVRSIRAAAFAAAAAQLPVV